MKVHTRIVLNMDLDVLEDEFFEYDGPVALCGGAEKRIGRSIIGAVNDIVGFGNRIDKAITGAVSGKGSAIIKSSSAATPVSAKSATAKDTTEAVNEAVNEQRRRVRASRGQQGTILTGPAGDQTMQAPRSGKKLLGQ